MRFGIVGAGAIGLLIAGLLTKAGHDVVLITRREEVIEEVEKNGIRIELLDGNQRILVDITTDLETLSEQEVVLLAVKSYDTAATSRRIRPYLSAGTTLVTLQNGLGNVETLEREFPGFCIVGGSTTMAVTLLGLGRVSWVAEGETVIGEPGSFAGRQTKRLAKIFSSSGMPTSTSSDLVSVLWSKTLINAGINPVTAVLRISNGELSQNDAALLVASEAVKEGFQVAMAEGIRFRVDPLQEMFKVLRSTEKNHSSMLQDMENHRRTEIDAINGSLVREGRRHSISTPVNVALWSAITSLESLEEMHPIAAAP